MKEKVLKYELDGCVYLISIQYRKSKKSFFKLRMFIDKTMEIVTNYNFDSSFIIKMLNDNKEWIKKSSERYDHIIEYFNKKNIHVSSLLKSEKYLFLGREWENDNFSNYKEFFCENEYVLKELYYDKTKNLEHSPELVIKALKGRWGSYNKKKHEITLNLYLLFFDEAIINYVIDHEITHIKIFNHQKEFYLELAKRCPNYMFLKKELRMMTSLTEKLVAL